MNIPTQPQSSQQDWDFIDKIYCISLEHRTDRRVAAQAEFDRVGLGQRVEFLISQKHRTNAEEGNFIAQMNALRIGLEAGAQHIAVFEDDILFDRFSPQILRDAIEFMKADRDWNAFFFGCFVKKSRKTKYPSVLNVRFRSTSHAYAVPRAFAQQLVQTPWPGRCLDDLLCSLEDAKMYAAYPAFAFQSNSKTDNDKQIMIDRLRRTLGGIRRLQKWNEFTNLHIMEMFVVHIAVIFFVVAIAAWVHFYHR